jgi:hypothetical protein
MRYDSYGYSNNFSDIDAVTDEPKKYSSQDLRRVIHDAYTVYDYHKTKSYEWYKQVWRICNDELKRRKEIEEPLAEE